MTSAGREQRKAADTAHPRSKAATRTYGRECAVVPAVKSRSQGPDVHHGMVHHGMVHAATCSFSGERDFPPLTFNQ